MRCKKGVEKAMKIRRNVTRGKAKRRRKGNKAGNEEF